jgi:hypothetical protein
MAKVWLTEKLRFAQVWKDSIANHPQTQMLWNTPMVWGEAGETSTTFTPETDDAMSHIRGLLMRFRHVTNMHIANLQDSTAHVATWFHEGDPRVQFAEKLIPHLDEYIERGIRCEWNSFWTQLWYVLETRFGNIFSSWLDANPDKITAMQLLPCCAKAVRDMIPGIIHTYDVVYKAMQQRIEASKESDESITVWHKSTSYKHQVQLRHANSVSIKNGRIPKKSTVDATDVVQMVKQIESVIKNASNEDDHGDLRKCLVAAGVSLAHKGKAYDFKKSVQAKDKKKKGPKYQSLERKKRTEPECQQDCTKVDQADPKCVRLKCNKDITTEHSVFCAEHLAILRGWSKDEDRKKFFYSMPDKEGIHQRWNGKVAWPNHPNDRPGNKENERALANKAKGKAKGKAKRAPDHNQVSPHYKGNNPKPGYGNRSSKSAKMARADGPSSEPHMRIAQLQAAVDAAKVRELQAQLDAANQRHRSMARSQADEIPEDDDQMTLTGAFGNGMSEHGSHMDTEQYAPIPGEPQTLQCAGPDVCNPIPGEDQTQYSAIPEEGEVSDDDIDIMSIPDEM